jgi:hypothetical protein
MTKDSCNLYFFHEEDSKDILTTLLKVKSTICDRNLVFGLTYVPGLLNVPYEVALDAVNSIDKDFEKHPNAVILKGGNITDIFVNSLS